MSMSHPLFRRCGSNCLNSESRCVQRTADGATCIVHAFLKISAIMDPEKGVDGDLRWHDLRHESGSRYADRGRDARHIMMPRGRADLKTTERYLN